MPNELATPEAPAAPIVATPETAAPAPVVTPSEPVSLSVDDRLELSSDQRANLLFGKHAEPVTESAPATASEEPVAPVEQPAESAATEPPSAVAPESEETEEPAGITKNFRLHTEDPAQSAFIKAYKAALAVNPKVNPADVARLVGLDSASPEVVAVTPEIPGVVEQPQQPQDIVAARQEIANIEAQLDGAFDGELTKPEQAALIKQLAAKNRELSKLELRHELAAERQAESAKAAAQTTRQQEMQAVETEFPTLTDPDSDLSLELDRQFFAIAGNPDHPDFQKVNAAGFPAYLTKQAVTAVVARTMKKNPGMTEAQALAAVKGNPTAAAPVSPAVVVPAKPQTQPVPRTVLVTAPGGKPAPASGQLSIEQIRERAAADPNFRKAALGWSGDRVVA